MMHRMVCVVMLSLLVMPAAWADIPGPDGRRSPRPLPPLPGADGLPNDARPKPLPHLLIVQNPNEPSARLVLPANATAARKVEEMRTVQAAGFPFVGLALVGSLLAGGLWLARMPRAKYLLAAALPVGAIALAGIVVAQPARPEPGRTVIETMKVRISRASVGSDYQLILPKRPAH
jgi:hypothetical protein